MVPSSELEDPTLLKLQSACSHLRTILRTSTNIDTIYEKTDDNFESIQQNLTTSSKTIAPLQSLSIANKALETRINRATSPGLALLSSFKLAESLQRKLLHIAAKLVAEEKPTKRLKRLIEYLQCVSQLNEAINMIGQESEPAIQKLQEVVEFLSRTKATDRYRTERLRETLMTLRAVCDAEIDSMRFDGVLDEALLNLQDEYEGLLQVLRHRNIGDEAEAEAAGEGLGSEMEVEVLRRISEILAANDCLDICIDMFVKVRYKRAAKALMRLSPDYLKSYSPEDIDEMEWETLESSISLWIQHLEVAVNTVVVSEKTLCNQVLGNIMDGAVWPECFIKIADKIMAVFFRFGEGVARSTKEPQKLFKLLDMFDSLEKLKPRFTLVFHGEPGSDICSRFRELEKLLVHASTKVFWELGLQIEGNQNGLPTPQDGAVPKLVRYAINFLKNLAVDNYSALMGQVLRTEQLWKSGTVLNPENDQELLKDAISNVMEAIGRNIESQKARYKDKILAQIFCMNTYWYIYMRTRNTELGKVLGDPYMKKRYRNVAEECAYVYQKQAWGNLARFLEIVEGNKEAVRGKMEGFVAGFDDMCSRHRSSYKIVSDADLREQMKEATVRLILPAYTEFYDTHLSVLRQLKGCRPPELIESSLRQIFDGADQGKPMVTRRGSRDQIERRMSVDRSNSGKDYRQFEFDNSDL